MSALKRIQFQFLLVTALLTPTLSLASTSTKAAADFMSRLCGTWFGSGVADGKKITEQLVVVWAVPGRSLKASSRATSGDTFASTTELAYSSQSNTFASTEMNNGKWPKRSFIGRLESDTLNLEEFEAQRRVRLSISLRPDGTLMIEEAFAHGSTWAKPFVALNYRKSTTEGRCAA